MAPTSAGCSSAAALTATFSTPQPDDARRLFDGLHAAAVTERHAALGGKLRNESIVGLAVLRRRVDVEDDELIRFFLVEDLDRVDRVTDVLGLTELDGLDQPAVLHEQARNDAWSEH
jgi:hypothetical protein